MNWQDLSLNEKSELMRIYLKNGISSLDAMREHYNSFQAGGIVDNPNNPKKKPKFQQSEEQYYDHNNDIIYAQDSIGEGYQHEYFHARPNNALLNNLRPYYENLNDNRLIELGADLPFVKRVENDPNYFYSPEEIGARVSAARYMLEKAGVKNIDAEFLKNARLNELKYGDNFRDLLHMYNDENLLNIFNGQYQKGGSLGHITNLGQWKYPGEVTTIPSNNITMKGVDYPVIGVSNTGDTKYMLPNMDYLFEGQYVTEYPVNSYQKGGQIDKKPEDSSFVSELDWSPESWFSKRVAKPDGTYYNADEAARLASHVPEYHNIEQTSKQNGTWLKMGDGSTWEGDPRAWVMMQSQAYRRNYSPKPWYTGQAEWPTQFDYPEDKKGAVNTNKMTRAPYYNGQMWFSNDKTYGDAFSYYYASTGEGIRQSIPEEANVSGHTFLSAIPKKGIYRKLAAPKPGTADVWDSMPYFLQNGHIYREKPSNISTKQDFRYTHNTRKDGKKVLTDDIVNWSRDLGDQGIFLYQVDDGRGIKFSGDVTDILKRYSEGRNAKKKVKKSEFQFTYPILEEFISQPGFTDKVKFIEGNTGDFDINNPYKYAENVFDNNSSQDTPHYAALGGHLFYDISKNIVR